MIVEQSSGPYDTFVELASNLNTVLQHFAEGMATNRSPEVYGDAAARVPEGNSQFASTHSGPPTTVCSECETMSDAVVELCSEISSQIGTVAENQKKIASFLKGVKNVMTQTAREQETIAAIVIKNSEMLSIASKRPAIERLIRLCVAISGDIAASARQGARFNFKRALETHLTQAHQLLACEFDVQPFVAQSGTPFDPLRHECRPELRRLSKTNGRQPNIGEVEAPGYENSRDNTVFRKARVTLLDVCPGDTRKTARGAERPAESPYMVSNNGDR